ncbi:MAG: hypothetical protein BWK80_30695 [Desulfobacteraceae bacterium IS3]|nr:MAG: hypothetical protein BWK80_30695 [Desulfobacteraceae bacterium IS3]
MKIKTFCIFFILLAAQEICFSADIKPDQKAEGEKTLVIAMSKSFPPLAFLNAEGNPAGLFVDIWKLWSEKTGSKIEFLPSAWNETMENLKNGKADIHSGLASTPEREKWMAFSQALYENFFYLFFPLKQGKLLTVSEMAGQKVGVVPNSSQEEFLRRKHPDIELVLFESTEKAILAASEGTIRAVADSYLSTSADITRLGLSGEFGCSQQMLYSKTFHAGILKENKSLLALADKGFDAISDKELAEIESRWIPDPAKRYYHENRKKIRLTVAEQAWLGEHKTVRVGLCPDCAPAMFLEDGKLVGFVPDYLDSVSEYMGIAFERIPIAISDFFDAVKRHDIDMFIGIESTERKEFMNYTQPVFFQSFVIINQRDEPFINGIQSLRNKKAAVVKGAAFYERLLKDYPEVKLHVAENHLEALKSVLNGKADAYIGPIAVATYLIQKHALNHLKIAAMLDDSKIGFGFLIRNDWKELHSIMNKAIASMPGEHFEGFYKKWVSIRAEHVIDWKFVLPWILASCVIVLITLFWNRRLSKEVARRSAAEDALNASLNIFKKMALLSVEDILKHGLEEGSRLTRSRIGFFHFVNPDQKTIHLKVWSQETLKNCTVGEPDTHYLIECAGVWADCIRERKPVIHNDYQHLAHKKGLPEGHVPLMREMVIPIFEQDKVVAILGVGNKAQQYSQPDAEQLSLVAENVWNIIQRKQTENALKDSLEKLRELESIINKSHAIAFLWRAEEGWPVEYVSENISQFGYMPEDFINGTVMYSSVIHPDDMLRVRHEIRQYTQESRTEFTQEYRIIGRDGTIHWTHDRTCIRRDKEGNTTHYQGIVLDITEQRLAEYALRKTEQEKAAILNNLHDTFIIYMDTDMRIIWASETLKAFFSCSFEDIHGKHCFDVLHRRTSPCPECEAYKAIQTGQFHQGEHSTAEGQCWMTRTTPVKNESGDVTGAVHIAFNITDRKLAEEALKEAKEAAEAANRAKSDFLARMSHEIRTPMSAVIGMSHLALGTELTARQRDYIEKIQTAATSLLGILNDILDFSKIEAGKLEMESVNFRLEEVLNNLSVLVKAKTQEKGLELIFDVDKGVPDVLIGDPLRLGQILVNLVSNAVKFTEQGEIVVGVRGQGSGVRGAEQSHPVNLLFSVRDTGIGIPPEKIGSLFDAFTQADDSTTRKYGGTGLGLAICKRLVKMMGGKIWAKSSPGEGSTFYFTAELRYKPQDKTKQIPDTALQGMRALVVDDNELSRMTLSKMLESLTFETSSVSSGEAALVELEKASAETKPYSLVLMDWRLPGMNGLEAAVGIMRDQRLSPIPNIIMMSSFAGEEVIQAAKRKGLSHFFVKPITSSVLFDIVMESFGQRSERIYQPQLSEIKEKELSQHIRGSF